MIYLLAFIIPFSFLYSPPVEEVGAVYITKTMTITQERKTPAYTVFQQAQKILNPVGDRQISASQVSEVLTLVEPDSIKELYPKAQVLNRMNFDRKELLEQTDFKLSQLVQNNQDSPLLKQINEIESPFADPKQSQPNSASIQGFFELSEGVGITNHSVSVRHVKEGQSIEIGQVDLKAGLYQIFVNSFDGELVAEIRDEKGILIGEDRKRIAGLKRVNNYFTGPQLKLGRPAAFGLNAKRADDQVFNDPQVKGSLFSGNYDVGKLDDVYPNVTRLSSTLAILESPLGKTASTISLRTVRDSSNVVLFSKSWIDGAIQYLSEKNQIQYMPDAGVIVGRVYRDGQPLAGAQVLIENQPGVEPYYLDQFLIPGIDQTSTSANGYFIIPRLQSGSYQISAFLQDHLLGSQAYFVENKIVSYQEIRTGSAMKMTTARSFDAFAGNTVMTELQIPGHPDIVELDGEFVRYPEGTKSGLVEIINRPVQREYLPYIYMQNQVKDFLHLPQLSEEFIARLLANRTISLGADTSLFIGFAQLRRYQVHVVDENFDPKNIIYFNARGEISEQPVPHGGFLLANVPLGTQEVIVENIENDRMSSQVFFSKNGMNYLSHFEE